MVSWYFNASIGRHFAGNVAPGQARHDRAPDRKGWQSPAQLTHHVFNDDDGKLDGIEFG